MVSIKFLEKVEKLGIVDTRLYRYIAKECNSAGVLEVKRLPVKYLGTTLALNSWEHVSFIVH